MSRAIAFAALITLSCTSAKAQYLSQMNGPARPGMQVMFVVTALKPRPPELPPNTYQVLASLGLCSVPWRIPNAAPGMDVWCWLYPDALFWHTAAMLPQTTNPPLFSWRQGTLDQYLQGVFYVNVPRGNHVVGMCLRLQVVTRFGFLAIPCGATNVVDLWVHP